MVVAEFLTPHQPHTQLLALLLFKVRARVGAGVRLRVRLSVRVEVRFSVRVEVRLKVRFRVEL